MDILMDIQCKLTRCYRLPPASKLACVRNAGPFFVLLSFDAKPQMPAAPASLLATQLISTFTKISVSYS